MPVIVLPALWLKVKLSVVIRSTIKYFHEETDEVPGTSAAGQRENKGSWY